MPDSEEQLKEFLISLRPTIEGYKSSTPYPNDIGEPYISFSHDGIKYQNIKMPNQVVLSTDKFKQTIQDYAQDKERLIIRDWPTIKQDKDGRWTIQARLVGDDGQKELRV